MRTRIILAMAAALSAAGCGLRGPLYLPGHLPPGMHALPAPPYKPVPYPRDTHRNVTNSSTPHP